MSSDFKTWASDEVVRLLTDERQDHHNASGRLAAAQLAAIANAPRGWSFAGPRNVVGGFMLRVTGPHGDEVEVWDESEDRVWRSMAEQLAALDRTDDEDGRRGSSYR